MKNTGVTRPIDSVGRITLPIELRYTLDLYESDEIEIFFENNMIYLKKYQISCVFCNSKENVTEHLGKGICKSCYSKLRKGGQA